MPIISECTRQVFTRLEDIEVVQDYSSIGTGNECTFELPVFAYPSDTTDTFRNDFSSTLLQINNRYSTPQIFLEVEGDCGVWSQVAELTSSNTYGTYYTFDSKPNWIGYKIDWYLVYNLEGVGCYRIKQSYDDTIEGTTYLKYGYKYNLRLWNEKLADKTTKITYTINGGKIGNVDNDKRFTDYKSEIWEREIRLPASFFGFESSEYTVESTRYKNGGQQQIKNEQIEKLQYYCKRLPYSLHRALKVEMMQCGEIYISDYNLGNPYKFYDHKRVKPSSDYSPVWGLYNSYAPVLLEFNPYYENLQRKLC